MSDHQDDAYRYLYGGRNKGKTLAYQYWMFSQEYYKILDELNIKTEQ